MTNETTVLRVGTRGSTLAHLQTQEALGNLRQSLGSLDIEVITIRTKPDVNSGDPLNSFNRGMFVSELEDALLQNSVDVVIHSLKDLPTSMPSSLSIGAVSRREDPRDVLIARSGKSLDKLPIGSRIGTSSPRRVCQIRAIRKDLDIVPIRGNIDSRFKMVESGDYEAIVVAAAAINRLGISEHITQFFSTEEMTPAPGQGALAVQIRSDDDWIKALLTEIHHYETAVAVTAERAFLQRLGGGCMLPLGAYAQLQGEVLYLDGIVFNSTGDEEYLGKASGSTDKPELLGLELAENLLLKGVADIL